MSGLDQAARDFAGIFEQLGIEYAIMGGLAVRVHAIPRPTFDVDFTASLPRSSLPDFYREVEALGYTLPEPQRSGWVDSVSDLPVLKFQTPIGERTIDLDVFLAETPFQVKLLERRLLVRTPTGPPGSSARRIWFF